MTPFDPIRAFLMPSATPNGFLVPGVALYGDSIMANGIAHRLQAAGVVVNDLSQSGDSAANAWRRFAYDLRTMQTVVLQHGTNDLSAGRDPVPYLRRMAKHAMAEGRRVMFTGITHRELPCAYSWQRANDDIRKLAADLQCAHASWNGVAYSSEDLIHPDAAMAERLVTRLMETLAQPQ
ncbi:SGNH/GDSL hydrolase family protein [Variovorax sp. GB1P17]|uniref:SGNH/GDSL hydrolase family protein n=1 Tax=Variovorax sp. GB1P17 TaxID=3443740 RepID=UPI003F4887FC